MLRSLCFLEAWETVCAQYGTEVAWAALLRVAASRGVMPVAKPKC